MGRGPMSKLFTPVHALVLCALLASPGAFAGGRDGGGNGDSRTLQAGDEFGFHREIDKRQSCVDNAFNTDELRRCDMMSPEHMETEQY